jgi:hypothetical protein
VPVVPDEATETPTDVADRDGSTKHGRGDITHGLAGSGQDGDARPRECDRLAPQPRPPIACGSAPNHASSPPACVP